MTAAPLSPQLRAAAPAIAARLTIILMALAAVIAHAFLRNPRRVGIIVALWSRITRAARRFARLATRLAAGETPRPSRPDGHSGPPPARLPTARGWLVADLKHAGAVYAAQLETLLAEPLAAELLAASPAAARILRPLCRMLGIAAAQRTGKPAKPPTPIPPPPTPIAAAPRPLQRAPEPPCPRARWPWRPLPAAKPA